MATTIKNAAGSTVYAGMAGAGTVGDPFYPCPNLPVSGVSAADITNTTAQTLIAAPGASLYLHITSLSAYNSHATVATRMDFMDDATVIHSCYLPAAGGRYEVTFPTPLKLSANKALKVVNGTTGSATRANAVGYTAG